MAVRDLAYEVQHIEDTIECIKSQLRRARYQLRKRKELLAKYGNIVDEENMSLEDR